MGANYSSYGNQNVYRNGFSAPKTTSGLLTEVHSTAKWKSLFDASKVSGKLMVIDFTATWCKPCRFMEPSLKEFAAKYPDVEFIKIDVDELMDVAQQFGVQVMPTFILMKNGKTLDKVVGAKKDELQQKIEKHRV